MKQLKKNTHGKLAKLWLQLTFTRTTYKLTYARPIGQYSSMMLERIRDLFPCKRN